MEEKETKDLLVREEIKTMQKDISRLQETEAEKEREKITQLKTGEEEKLEEERRKRAHQEATLREEAEIGAQKKQEQLKRLKEEREKKEKILEQEEKVRQEFKAGGFREKFHEIQTKEAEERRRFLERVEERATGQPIQETPTPTPIPSPVFPPVSATPPTPFTPPTPPEKRFEQERPEKKIPEPLFFKSPRKPSLFDKLWIRIVFGLLALAILGGLATFWYWYLVVKDKAEEKIQEEVKEELVIPTSLIVVEKSETLEVADSREIPNVFSGVLNKDLGEKQFTRVIIVNTAENKVAGMQEFFTAFQAAVPAELIDDAFTLFLYSTAGINRLGFVVEIKGTDLNASIKSWELTMENDLDNLLVSSGKTEPSSVTYFQEATYKNNVFRYLSLQPKNFGVCWSIIDNYFILTTSGESMIKTIDKIKSKK